MRSLRAFFLNLQFREKALLVIFAVLIVAVWFSTFNTRFWKFQAAARSTGLELKEHSQLLAQRQAIEEAAKNAAARLDPTKTLDGTGLFATVQAIATEAGLRNPRIGEQQEQTNGQFVVHSLRFSVQKADWDTLKKFYLSIQARSPYIGIETFSLNADKASPASLNATMEISSVEVPRANP